MGAIILLSLFFIPSISISSDNTYLVNLIKKALDKELYKDRYWNVLLHYKHGLSGTESLIDDPAFFLAQDGKENPEAELIETLRSFFREYEDEKSNPRCRFPARYAWLKEKLDIDEDILPPSRCIELERFLDALKPESATLVFPAAYMNSPASMFGHTLIRIDSSYKSKLLSHAVNYAANTGDEGGISYLIKGLFGFFKGYFSILPYYEKIEEYSDLDMRDMWEYELNLTEDEVRKMVLHIWELKDIYSYYYFFDENCSYNLLFLLEAARPEVDLTDGFRQWVIPSDTVRAVIDRGLVRSVSYRPSRATRIRHMASYIPENYKIEAVEIASGSLMPDDILIREINNKEKAIILDIAAEMTQYKFMRQKLDRKNYQERFLQILKVRKELGKLEPEVYTVPAPARPDEGHSSGRLSTGTGLRNKEWYQAFMWRPAYHDLMDPDEGFQEGSEIIFVNLGFRYYYEKRRFQLQNIDIINIVSLGIRDEFFRPLSWKVHTGFRRELMKDYREHLIYILNPGFGIAGRSRVAGIYFAFTEAELKLSGSFRDNYSAGIGFSAGMIKNITDKCKLGLQAKTIFYEPENNKLHSISLKQNYKITKDTGLRLNLERIKYYSNYWTEGELILNFYF
ncbi:MAG: DUF4105 domain-containing protein [Thermodesulfovibrionales bacterium]|nr:DUF4105 domain-containing protein [Thermodesulfovibrionales bacterium]